MLLIDNRQGSNDLVKPLRKLGLEVESCRLEFGDVAFAGRGDKGEVVEVGVEVKKLNDLIQCLRDGRLSGHQLPGMGRTFDHRWLVVQGQWQHDEHGLIVSYKGKMRGWQPTPGKMSAQELEKQVFTLEMMTGTHIRFVNNEKDMVRVIVALYRWWTDKGFDQHKSHLHMHTKPTLVQVSKTREAMMKWPGIGFKASRDVETYFKGSIRNAVNAGVDEWQDISIIDDKGKPRRIGQATAQRIVAFFK